MIIHNFEQRLDSFIGKRFGSLTVKERLNNNKDGHKKYLCICDCGEECSVCATLLKNGKKTKCSKCSFIGINKKHGLKGTRIYRIWRGIKERCLNKNSRDYKNYGERGIKICEEWRDSKWKNQYTILM